VSYRAAGIIGLALSRVTSDDAHAQYVPAGQPEAYQLKSEQQLAVDVCEELADAVAYLAPLAEKNALYAEAVEHIALAHQIVTLTAWRDA
jgi:hypothetical protein